MNLAAVVTAALLLGVANSSSSHAADATEGKKVFQQCAACHSLKAGENKIGPTLAGIVGRKAGGVSGFNYSKAMADSGLTWDDAALHRYLANPKAVVPNGKMVFAGVKDPQRLDNLIEYLKQAAP